MIPIALNMERCQLFDKETELTILARTPEGKEEIEQLQLIREAELAEKAVKEAEAAAEEEAKLATMTDAQRERYLKKKAKK